MSRVKIRFPSEKPVFQTKIKIRITDLNYGNHLGNDSLLRILHEARMQWLTSIGFSELDVGGCGLIMADVMIAYKKEGFYGDELSISIYTDEIQKNSFDILYRIETIRASVKIDIAAAKTGMVCYDYQSRKIVVVPEIFIKNISQNSSSSI